MLITIVVVALVLAVAVSLLRSLRRSVVAHLVEELEHEDLHRRGTAVVELGRFELTDKPFAVAALLRVALDPAERPDIRVAAAVTSVQAGTSEEGRAFLLSALGDEAQDPALRARIVGALAPIAGHSQAVLGLFRGLTDDPQPKVRLATAFEVHQLDPSWDPVPTLEQLLEEPDDEVRIGAVQALTGVGTPAARAALKRAADDRSEAVRHVAAVGLVAAP